MNCFSHGCHGQQYCSWARMHDDNGDGTRVTQDGGHTPANKLAETCTYGLQCYGQLTPVKTRNLLTNIT